MPKTRLQELAEAIHEELAEPSFQLRHDVKALQQHDVLRRIVWLTEGGTGDTPRQAGGRPSTSDPSVRIVSSRMRVEDVQVHIYAEDRATAEQTLDRLIAAADEVLSTSLQGFSYRWVTEERPNAGQTLRSSKCVLRMQVRMPVVVRTEPLHPLPPPETLYGMFQEDDTIAPHPEE